MQRTSELLGDEGERKGTGKKKRKKHQSKTGSSTESKKAMKETGTDTFNEGESKGSEKPLDKGKAPSYYAASPFPSHSMYPASPTPSMLPLPVIPLPEQCSPFQISPFKLPQSQVCPQAHQVSPKMAQLSPGSSAYSNCIYSSNPASPMQVVYSPGQCHIQTTSTDNFYQQFHGGTSLPLPLYPSPDYYSDEIWM